MAIFKWLQNYMTYPIHFPIFIFVTKLCKMFSLRLYPVRFFCILIFFILWIQITYMWKKKSKVMQSRDVAKKTLSCFINMPRWLFCPLKLSSYHQVLFPWKSSARLNFSFRQVKLAGWRPLVPSLVTNLLAVPRIPTSSQFQFKIHFC